MVKCVYYMHDMHVIVAANDYTDWSVILPQNWKMSRLCYLRKDISALRENEPATSSTSIVRQNKAARTHLKDHAGVGLSEVLNLKRP